MAQSVPDDILVAQLDGRLSATEARELGVRLSGDPASAARMAALQSASINFAAALGGRNPACPPDLMASINALLDRHASERARAASGSGLAAIRGALACRFRHLATSLRGPGFAPGAFVGAATGAALVAALVLSFGGLGQVDAPASPGSIASVAEKDQQFIDDIALYQAFYSKETVASAPLSEEQRHASLTLVGDRLQRGWRAADLAVEGLEFRRAQILSFGIEPVAQIILSDAEGEPFALCVKPTEAADRAISIETRHGMAVASWVTKGRVFVTAARPGLSRFEQASRKLVDRIS